MFSWVLVCRPSRSTIGSYNSRPALCRLLNLRLQCLSGSFSFRHCGVVPQLGAGADPRRQLISRFCWNRFRGACFSIPLLRRVFFEWVGKVSMLYLTAKKVVVFARAEVAARERNHTLSARLFLPVQ